MKWPIKSRAPKLSRDDPKTKTSEPDILTGSQAWRAHHSNNRVQLSGLEGEKRGDNLSDSL